MAIDWQSSVGKVRLRIGDVSDLPFLPDEVIQTAVNDAAGNLPTAAQTCAQYILAQLAFKSHKKMVQLEIWGAEAFSNYRQFLIDTISNPSIVSYTGIPVLVTDDSSTNDPLAQFTEDWNNCWANPENVTEMVHRLATYSSGCE